jgi:ABC-2 type transport system ATP-binding protein
MGAALATAFILHNGRARIRASMRAAMTDAAISIRESRKTYKGGKRALEGVTLDVPRGEIFGLLGPNGAGKSTMINILAGLVNKTGGEVTIWGFDIDRIRAMPRRRSASCPRKSCSTHSSPPPKRSTSRQACTACQGEAAHHGTASRRSPGDKAQAYSRTLSGGMKRRLLVAKAMVHSPPILCSDEPTAGVDIELRQQLWTYVRQLNRDGVTIVLTTHYLEEAEQLCDRIAIINHGCLIANEETRALVGHGARESGGGDGRSRHRRRPVASCFDKIELKARAPWRSRPQGPGQCGRRACRASA